MKSHDIKKGIKVLGIDDGPFDIRKSKYVRIVGTVFRGNFYMEAVMSSFIECDGMDATDKIITMIQNSHHIRQLKCIFIDGVTMGGFNPVDINRIYDETHIPVISLTRESPDFVSIKNALVKHFDDWEERWNILNNRNLYTMNNGGVDICFLTAGVVEKDARDMIKYATHRGGLPEALRISHIIGAGIEKGESGGRA